MTRLQRLPIRWRLALTSAGLTFAILLLFALIIGVFTARQVRSSFDDDLRLTAIDLSERVHSSSAMNTLGLAIQRHRAAATSRAAAWSGAAWRATPRCGSSRSRVSRSWAGRERPTSAHHVTV